MYALLVLVRRKTTDYYLTLQREHRYKKLLEQTKEKGLDTERFAFYLDCFRYGVPPHGGSGTGLERIVKQMLNLENVAEATLLPRTPERVTP